MKHRILVVDDERTIRRVVSSLLADAGYDVAAAPTGEDAVERAPAFRPDVALLDLQLPGIGGIAVMEALNSSLGTAAPAVIIITAHGTIRSAVQAMRKGAFDYITKPFDNDELQLVVRRALEVRGLQRRVEALESQIAERFRPENMVGHSSAMDGVFRLIGRVAARDTTVLVTGESGTGKELVARAIHRHSTRGAGPFVDVNCGAVPETLLESTFFGHEPGAFTDAKALRRGAFEQAHGGTLFLDEVTELTPAAQAGLLRALQQREFRRVGGEDVVPVDIRLIAATNRDLHREVGQGRFREDLYWRLNVVAIHLPPLRDRPEDIPLLAEHFCAKHARRLGSAVREIAPDALSLLVAYDWPGNVRELENAIEGALTLAGGTALTAAELPPRIGGTLTSAAEAAADPVRATAGNGAAPRTLPEAVALAQHALESRMIRDALRAAGGNRTAAAERLGISRKTLFNKMQQLGLDKRP